MTHSDCPVPINNLSLSKIADFGDVKNCVEIKTTDKHDNTFSVKAKCFM